MATPTMMNPFYVSGNADDGYDYSGSDWWGTDPYFSDNYDDPFGIGGNSSPSQTPVGPIPINTDPNVIGSTPEVGPIPVNKDPDVIGVNLDTPKPVPVDLSSFPPGHGVINTTPTSGGNSGGGFGGFGWPGLIGAGLVGAGVGSIFSGGGGGDRGNSAPTPGLPGVGVGTPTRIDGSPNETPLGTSTVPPPYISGGGPQAPAPTQGTSPTRPALTPPTLAAQNPLDRNYYNEGASSIYDLARLAPNIFGLYQDQAAQYGQADLNRFGSVVGQYGGLNDQLSNLANRQTQTANTSLRQGNLQDAQNLGPQTDALRRSLNPELYSNLTKLDQTAQTGIGRNEYQNQLGDIFSSGTSALGQDLGNMARSQLALGTSVSPMEARDAQQSAREGWGARGLINSNGAVAEEVLNRYNLGNQRLKERQAFAQNAYGQEQSAAGQRNALGTNLASMDYSRQQNNFGNTVTAANARLQTQFDPFGFGNSANTGLNTNLFGQGSSFSSGSQGNAYVQNAYNPFNQYSNDVYGTNTNAANARSISAGNNAAALAGARDTTNGQLANSFLQILGSYYGSKGWGS